MTISATNARALAIKNHLFSSSAYANIAAAYQNNATLKSQIDNHNHPDSANATNDPKIDNFLRAIESKQSKLEDTWNGLDANEKQSIRGNPQVRLLITSNHPTLGYERLAQLGFVDGAFDTGDYEEARNFLMYTFIGESLLVRAQALNMGQKAKSFLAGHADLRPFGDFWTSIKSGHLGFAIEYNTDDLIALLKS